MEGRDGLELRGRLKSRVLDGHGSFNVSAFYMDIHDLQATVTAGSCSSRVIFNVPKARSAGVELEFDAAPNRNFDFALSASYNNSKLRSTLTSTDPTGTSRVVSGIESRTTPADRAEVPDRGRRHVPVGGQVGNAGLRHRHVPAHRLALHAGRRPGPRHGEPAVVRRQHDRRAADASTFTFDPELPAYDLVNLRVGVRRTSGTSRSSSTT